MKNKSAQTAKIKRRAGTKKKLGLFVALMLGALVLWNLYRFAYDKSFLWACVLFICTFITCSFAGLLLMKMLNPPFPYRINLLLKLASIMCAVPSACIILGYCGVRAQLMLSVRQSLLLAIAAGAIWGLQKNGCFAKKGN